MKTHSVRRWRRWAGRGGCAGGLGDGEVVDGRRGGRGARGGLIWALMTRVCEVPRVRQTTQRTSSSSPRKPQPGQLLPPVHNMSDYSAVQARPSPSLSLLSTHRPFSLGVAQGHPRLCAHHPRVAPSVPRLRSPRRHLCPRILLLHVCLSLFHCLPVHPY